MRTKCLKLHSVEGVLRIVFLLSPLPLNTTVGDMPDFLKSAHQWNL